MKFELIIYLTQFAFPHPDSLVIVEGGVARWNGKDWLSGIDEGRVIEWPVTWWAHLPVHPFGL